MTGGQRAPSRETSQSRQLHERACELFPGGVSHNVRYTEPHPIYVDRVAGPYLWDSDGNRYVDFWNNHHASLLGHIHEHVTRAVAEQVENGLHYGAPHEAAIELAEKVRTFIPSAERLRFCVSGTEATMYAVRLARAYTGNEHILKIEAGWHGGNTDLSVGVYPPFDAPTTAGLPPGPSDTVHPFRLNDQSEVLDLLEQFHHDVAAVIIDPRKAGIPPSDDFLHFLSDAREDHGFQLIFDEIVTGFRVSPGSYQARVGVTPDLTAIGKCLGGGLPIGAIVGRKALFEPARPDIDVDPTDRVIAGGGTFSVHPLSIIAGLATLEVIENEPVHEHTESLGRQLREGFDSIFQAHDIDGRMLGLSSLVLPVFNPEGAIETPTDVKTKVDKSAAQTFHRRLLDHGYYFLPGRMGNLSYQVTDDQVQGVVEAARAVVGSMKADGIL